MHSPVHNSERALRDVRDSSTERNHLYVTYANTTNDNEQ